MSECNHDCSSCSQSCADRDPRSLLAEPHPGASFDKIVAVVSGKGGVGKSLVTGLMAVNAQRAGYQAAILDADVTGPSVPRMFGIRQKATVLEQGIVPLRSKGGVDIISINVLLPTDTEAVLWRGPILGGVVKQFWSDVIWKDVDCMFIDMPPGTGDVPLTVFQSLPVDGIIVVTSPQDLVTMIVEKAINMANLMNVPILGLVENMSYFVCPDNGKSYQIFGESRVESVAREHGLKVLAKIPIDPLLSAACDRGEIESFAGQFVDEALDAVEATPNRPVPPAA